MKIKIVLGALLFALLGFGWWATRASDRERAELTLERSVPVAAGGGEAVLEQPRSEPTAVEQAGGPVREALEASATASESVSDPWAGELGGVIGRVVEEDGTPVVGIAVALVQVDANFVFGPDWARLGEKPPELVQARAITDDEGRFHLDGAYDASYQGIGIDLRGPRSSLRVVDTQLHHRELTDLGDLVLRAGCTVTGRVIDETGAPVAGVRVRMIPALPDGLEAVVPLELQDFRSDCSVGVSSFLHDGSSSPVVELPPLVRRHLDDLPIPTTRTDEDGRYRFEGAPIGGVVLAIDRRGWLGLLRGDDTEPGEVELPDAVLRAGRTLRGQVVNSSGDPVAGVEVMAGVEIAGTAAILQPAGKSDAEGEFSVAGCPLVGSLMACARRSPGEPWVGVIDASADDLEIEVEDAFRVMVHVVDIAGKPVSGARVELEPGFESDSPMGFMVRFSSLGAPVRASRFEEVEPGIYACADVSPGHYEVRARPLDLADASQDVELHSGGAPITLTCRPGLALDLTVLDQATGEPVHGARASIVNMERDLFGALAVGRTSREGVVRLGPFALPVADSEGRGRVSGRAPSVLVQHPRYADAALELNAGMATAELSLVRGGELRGNIHWGPAPPQRLYMLMLEQRGVRDDLLQFFLPPRLGRSGLDGSFRFTNLAAGEYRLDVYERWLDGDALDLMLAQPQPVLVHREENLQVEAGITRDVSIDLSPDGGGQTARLTGWVRLDGRPAEGATVRVWATGGAPTVTTDAEGFYETVGFLTRGGSVRVSVSAEIDGNRSVLFEGQVEPLPGTVHRLDVDAGSSRVQARVTDRESGDPIQGARISARLKEGSSRTRSETDEEGEVWMTVVATGDYKVVVEASGYMSMTRELNLVGGESGAVEEFQLVLSTPCAGTCDLSARADGDLGQVYLQIQGDGFSEFTELDADELRVDSRASFQVDGMAPGEYKARFWVAGDWSEEITFQLPVGGNTDLTLRHP